MQKLNSTMRRRQAGQYTITRSDGYVFTVKQDQDNGAWLIRNKLTGEIVWTPTLKYARTSIEAGLYFATTLDHREVRPQGLSEHGLTSEAISLISSGLAGYFVQNRCFLILDRDADLWIMTDEHRPDEPHRLAADPRITSHTRLIAHWRGFVETSHQRRIAAA